MVIEAICILIFFYIFVSILDVQSRLIPVWLWIIPVNTIIIAMLTDADFSISQFGLRLMFGAVFFGVGILLCITQGMGGADALMMLTIGMAFGTVGVLMLTLGFILAIPVALIIQLKSKTNGGNTEYPLLPSITIGVVITLIGMKLMGVSTPFINI